MLINEIKLARTLITWSVDIECKMRKGRRQAIKCHTINRNAIFLLFPFCVSWIKTLVYYEKSQNNQKKTPTTSLVLSLSLILSFSSSLVCDDDVYLWWRQWYCTWSTPYTIKHHCWLFFAAWRSERLFSSLLAHRSDEIVRTTTTTEKKQTKLQTNLNTEIWFFFFFLLLFWVESDQWVNESVYSPPFNRKTLNKKGSFVFVCDLR